MPAIVAVRRPGDELLLRQRAFGEEGLHQLLVGLGDHLDQLLARVLRGVGERGRDLAFGHLAAVVAGERQRLHRTRSTTPVNAFSSPSGS